MDLEDGAANQNVHDLNVTTTKSKKLSDSGRGESSSVNKIEVKYCRT